jgi:hypothetical protein
LQTKRIGLFVALGRPERLLGALARHGVLPGLVVRGRDHGHFPKAAFDSVHTSEVDLWLATAKCELHVRSAGMHQAPGVRGKLAVLDHSLAIHPLARRRLRSLAIP